MSYPIDTIRSKFPSLNRIHNGKEVIYFDGPSGSQVVQQSIDAMVNYMTQGSANLGSPYQTSKESDSIVADARSAMADFLGGSSDEIAFGMNMTSLAFDISRALAVDWKKGDNIVVTEIDHMANVDTWISAAEEKGVEVRWIPLDTDTLTLDLSALNNLIDNDTVLVAVGQASNGVGTINDLNRIITRVRNFDAIIVVDAVHSAPHMYIDRDQLDVDIIMCSAYKFFGPHIGIATIRKTIFEKLSAYRISTAPINYPGKLETGTQSIEGLAGVTGAVNFLASIGEGETRKSQLKDAFTRIHDHETRLADEIRNYLDKKEEVTLLQADVAKTPTIAFLIEGIEPVNVVKHLDNHAIFAGAGHFYAKTIAESLDLENGWVRIGMAPYNSIQEVERFKQAIDELLQ